MHTGVLRVMGDKHSPTFFLRPPKNKQLVKPDYETHATQHDGRKHKSSALLAPHKVTTQAS